MIETFHQTFNKSFKKDITLSAFQKLFQVNHSLDEFKPVLFVIFVHSQSDVEVNQRLSYGLESFTFEKAERVAVFNVEVTGRSINDVLIKLQYMAVDVKYAGSNRWARDQKPDEHPELQL